MLKKQSEPVRLKLTTNFMNKEKLAALLMGREYRDEITDEEVELVVVFGASDDLIEFRGSIDDEYGCNDGGTFSVDAHGALPEYEHIDHEDENLARDYFKRKDSGKAKKLEALWCNEPGYSWTYKTKIPHATFEIVEDGKPYCRGIIFDISELK